MNHLHNPINVTPTEIIWLLFCVVALGSIIVTKILGAKYDFQKESDLLRRFLYTDEATSLGYDTRSMGDFEKWKKTLTKPEKK